jgi:hypothetical protein
MSSRRNPTHPWNFFRSGGLDQAVFGSGGNMPAFDQLDQKLRVSLGCPVTGLELDHPWHYFWESALVRVNEMA